MVIELDGHRITDIDAYLTFVEVQIDSHRKRIEALEDRRGLVLTIKAAAAKQAGAKKKDGKN